MYMYIDVDTHVYVCVSVHTYVNTLACVGGAESYYDQVFCLCVCSQNLWTTNNIGNLIKLPTDMKLYKAFSGYDNFYN